MTKQLTQKDQVAIFVRYQPNCAVGDVSEALDMSGATAGKLLRELSDDGVITRSRNSVQYTYTAVPHADIPDVILPCMEEKRGCVAAPQRCIRTCSALPAALWRLPGSPNGVKSAYARREGLN